MTNSKTAETVERTLTSQTKLYYDVNRCDVATRATANRFARIRREQMARDA